MKPNRVLTMPLPACLVLALFALAAQAAPIDDDGMVAVVKVKLDDGSTVEGFWWMESSPNWSPVDEHHGFYWPTADGDYRLMLITKAETSFDPPSDRTRLAINQGASRRELLVHGRQDRTLESDELLLVKTDVARYELSETLVLHLELFKERYSVDPLEASENTRRVRIPVSEIERFQVSWQPSRAMLDEIAEWRAVQSELYQKFIEEGGIDSGDIGSPTWFHESRYVRERLP